MTETTDNNPEQEQADKPKKKISRLAVWSFLCLIFVVITGPISDQKWLPEWVAGIFFFMCKICFYLSAVLGVAGIISTFWKKLNLKGIPLALLWIPPWYVVIFYVIPMANGLNCRDYAPNISEAIYRYAEDHKDNFPNLDRWCDVLVDGGYIERKHLRCPNRKGPCNYALNNNLQGLTLSQVPDEMVVVFETEAGWNQVGGSEIIVDCRFHFQKSHGCRINFGNGSSQYIKNLTTLQWEP